MSQPEPLTEQRLTPDREQKIRRNYASFDSDGTVNVLLAEIDRLRAEGAGRDAQVMRRCAEFVRDTYDGEWADDAAATLERDADVTERGCPGYEDAGRGDTVAERQLANRKHCGRPRAVCVAASEATSASQPSEAPVEPDTATEASTGRTGDPRRTLTPTEYDAAWHAVEGAAGDEGADPGTILHAVLNRLGIDWQDAARTV